MNYNLIKIILRLKYNIVKISKNKIKNTTLNIVVFFNLKILIF